MICGLCGTVNDGKLGQIPESSINQALHCRMMATRPRRQGWNERRRCVAPYAVDRGEMAGRFLILEALGLAAFYRVNDA